MQKGTFPASKSTGQKASEPGSLKNASFQRLHSGAPSLLSSDTEWAPLAAQDGLLAAQKPPHHRPPDPKHPSSHTCGALISWQCPTGAIKPGSNIPASERTLQPVGLSNPKVKVPSLSLHCPVSQSLGDQAHATARVPAA